MESCLLLISAIRETSLSSLLISVTGESVSVFNGTLSKRSSTLLTYMTQRRYEKRHGAIWQSIEKLDRMGMDLIEKLVENLPFNQRENIRINLE